MKRLFLIALFLLPLPAIADDIYLIYPGGKSGDRTGHMRTVPEGGPAPIPGEGCPLDSVIVRYNPESPKDDIRDYVLQDKQCVKQPKVIAPSKKFIELEAFQKEVAGNSDASMGLYLLAQRLVTAKEDDRIIMWKEAKKTLTQQDVNTINAAALKYGLKLEAE